MKSTVLITILAAFLFACNTNEPRNISSPDTKALTVLSDSLAYTAIIKNPDPEDTWTTQCLKNFDPKTLANIIFDAVYTKKLTAYSYVDDLPMSIEDVKALETEYSRDKIGKVLFTEEWYFDKNKMQMHKVVNSIMMAYEMYDDSTTVKGYKAGIRVYFNGTEPKK